MPYRVVLAGSSDSPIYWINPHTGAPYEFETGEEAQTLAKQIGRESSQKWRVKRVLDTKWKTRERMKFENGTYDHMPWEGTSWWEDAKSITRHHYPHPSRSEPGMIAYTESDEKGMDNKQTQIKPGRYLEKYLNNVIVARWGMSIKALATEFEKTYKPRVVHFAVTEDEIQNVYERGPSSCMSSVEHRRKYGWGYPVPGKWPLDMHACRVYAGDLQVAYITHSDNPTGRIEGRSLVWPAKKTFSRPYGAEAQMRQALTLAGWMPSPPVGAKLQRHPVEANGMKLFVCPYIDIGQQSGQGALCVKDMKTHLEIVVAAPGTYSSNTTSGVCGGKLDRNMRPQHHNVENCALCEEHTDECGELAQVHFSGAQGDYRMWCQNCMEQSGTRNGNPLGAYACDHDGRWYERHRHPGVKMHDGQTWSTRAFRQNGFTCDATNKNYSNGNKIRLFNGTKWCASHFRANGFTCYYTGDHYPNEYKVMLGSGHPVCQTAAEKQTFECEGCTRRFMLSMKYKPRGLCPHCTEREHNGESRIRGHRPTTANEEYTS